MIDGHKRCVGCGIDVEVYENGVDCPECRRPFCDACYITGIGDGCSCHLPVRGDTGPR